MRLIDADAIEHCLVIGGIRNGKVIMSEFIRMAIQSAPTVDAIPVQWIKEYMENNQSDFGTQYMLLTRMINTWEKENGN